MSRVHVICSLEQPNGVLSEIVQSSKTPEVTWPNGTLCRSMDPETGKCKEDLICDDLLVPVCCAKCPKIANCLGEQGTCSSMDGCTVKVFYEFSDNDRPTRLSLAK